MYTNVDGATSVFARLREEIPIGRLIETNGHRKALCVVHEENTPSMHVYDDHAHCFGCGFHGDVVDVWSKQKGIERPIEAALDLAREFSLRLPEISEEGRRKADERREKEDSLLELAQERHDLLQTPPAAAVREWWKGRGFDEELQKRFLLGATAYGREAIIPFWNRGRVVGLIRRKLEGAPKYILPSAEELPEGYKPLFIPGSLGKDIFLTEGYTDALAVEATGKSAIAVGGTGLSSEQVRDLGRVVASGSATTFYILTDNDEGGTAAAREWGSRLFPNVRVCTPSYGEGAKDIADTLKRGGREETADLLDRLVATSQDVIDIQAEVAAEMPGGPREKLPYVFETIVPLLARISGDALRDATKDIVVDRVKGLKKSWLNNAIEEERQRLSSEAMADLMGRAAEDADRIQREHKARVAAAQEGIDSRLAPGVLGRLRGAAANIHNVRRDEKALELSLLVALGAQLDPLPNGRPLGASILMTAQAGRGKNHIVDAAVKLLPEEFYFAFEIASGQSLYYKADEDPEFLKHTFAYPNEIEGAEQLWEFLRPMLSGGKARKIVTAKDPDGNMTTREITVEGPVTIAIPTIRNKTDEQLQTRLLVAELPDYPGRVKEHSSAVSAQLLPSAAVADYAEEKFVWAEALRQLTTIRRVIFPMDHPDFALDDDAISHGARLWANLLSLMCAHAWLEQNNRRVVELAEGSLAVEATPDDYEAAHTIFNEVCKRTVVNLSDTHRKILDGLYKLEDDNPERGGFRQREIAEAGSVSLGAVSNHKTFLVTSAKLLKESEDGISLVEGADPSWWETGRIEGLPTPAQVRTWWNQRDPDPPTPPEHGEHVNTNGREGDKPHTYANSGVHVPDEHGVNTFMNRPRACEQDERVHGLFTEGVNGHNGVDKPNDAGEGGSVHVFTDPEGGEDPLPEERLRELEALFDDEVGEV